MNNLQNDSNAAVFVPASRAGAPAGGAAADVLSHVLTWVRLQGGQVGVEAIDAGELVREGAGPGRFYVMQTGVLHVSARKESVVLEPGALVLLPHGTPHELVASLHDKAAGPTTGRARFLCGSFRFDGFALPPVLSALPCLVHVPRAAQGDTGWLDAISSFLLLESDESRPGATLMVSRLIDLLVIRALRVWAAGSPHAPRLAVLGDDRIGRTLAALHATPFRAWTVPEMARVANMSRSGFADRFHTVVGESPLRYLARWRLILADELLGSGAMRIGEVAAHVGYASDAAFSRAFKACFGRPPGASRLSRGPRATPP